MGITFERRGVNIFGEKSTSKTARYLRLLLRAGGRNALREFEVLPNLAPSEREEFWRLRKELLMKKLVDN